MDLFCPSQFTSLSKSKNSSYRFFDLDLLCFLPAYNLLYRTSLPIIITVMGKKRRFRYSPDISMVYMLNNPRHSDHDNTAEIMDIFVGVLNRASVIERNLST